MPPKPSSLPTEPPVQPRDSASLVLLRGRGSRLEVLLGQRPESARFMPGRYVFPGGMLEPEDRRPSGFEERHAPPPDGLDWRSRRDFPVFARAALRETQEETGLLLGTLASGLPPQPSGVWQRYAEAGLSPAFEALQLFARAITPSDYPIRFHARYFLADGAQAQGTLRGNGELEGLAWVPLAETEALPLPSVTRTVLRSALLHRRALERAARSGRPLRVRAGLFA